MVACVHRIDAARPASGKLETDHAIAAGYTVEDTVIPELMQVG